MSPSIDYCVFPIGRDQITTTGVNMARLHNWAVKQKQQEQQNKRWFVDMFNWLCVLVFSLSVISCYCYSHLFSCPFIRIIFHWLNKTSASDKALKQLHMSKFRARRNASIDVTYWPLIFLKIIIFNIDFLNLFWIFSFHLIFFVNQWSYLNTPIKMPPFFSIQCALCFLFHKSHQSNYQNNHQIFLLLSKRYSLNVLVISSPYSISISVRLECKGKFEQCSD